MPSALLSSTTWRLGNSQTNPAKPNASSITHSASKLQDDRPEAPRSDRALKAEHRRARPSRQIACWNRRSPYRNSSRKFEVVDRDLLSRWISRVWLTVRREVNAVTMAISTISARMAK